MENDLMLDSFTLESKARETEITIFRCFGLCEEVITMRDIQRDEMEFQRSLIETEQQEVV